MSETKGGDDKVAKIKAIKATFEAGWKKESMNLSALTSDDWHKEKKLAAVKSAKWFQKSNNIGPKLDKLDSARKKLDKQVNNNNFFSVVSAIDDLEKAFTAFRKNRDGATPQQSKDINSVIDLYEKVAKDAGHWLATQATQVKIIDKAEMDGILNTV